MYRKKFTIKAFQTKNDEIIKLLLERHEELMVT